MTDDAVIDDLSAEFEAALARLPASLADDRARDGVRAIAARLPRELVTGPIGLEIRLAGPAQVDVFAAAVPRTPGFAGLVTALRRGGWVDDGQARDLADALGRWQAGEGALPAVARYLLVEADAPPVGGAVPVPSIFLAPRGANDAGAAGAPPNSFHTRIDVTTMAAAELSGTWPDPATAEALGEVVAALPPGAEIFAIGAMLSRAAGSSMRVAARRLTPDQMSDVLRTAGRPRQADLIAARADASVAERRVLAFEVGPGAEERVGLELSPWEDWKRASLRAWPELLDEIVRAGEAQPERADVVTALVDADGPVRWGLAHVKVAATADGMLPAAKLYVGLLHPQARGDEAR